MHAIASPFGVRVKASGGIRSADKVREMLVSGASRIGASGTRAIVAESTGVLKEATSKAAEGY
jgi:deoxyribose-phosphate aldolase